MAPKVRMQVQPSKRVRAGCCALRFDPGAEHPELVWEHGGDDLPLPVPRLQHITQVLIELIADLQEGRVLAGAFDDAVFHPLFAPGHLRVRPRVRRPHLASLSLRAEAQLDAPAYEAACHDIVIETRRLPVPGGGTLTAFHVELPITAVAGPKVRALETAVLRHELIHAFAAQVLGFRGHDVSRGLDPLCVSAETPGPVPEPRRASISAVGPAVSPSAVERAAGDEFRRRASRAISAVTDPHERLRVIQRLAAAFVEHWERNAGPVRPAAWRRIIGAGGESVEGWCAAQPRVSGIEELLPRASLALAGAEACAPGWALVRGPCDARAEVVQSALPTLVLRPADVSPGRVDLEGWLALVKDEPVGFAEALRQLQSQHPAGTLRSLWGHWLLRNPPKMSAALRVVAVDLDDDESAEWEAAAHLTPWLTLEMVAVGIEELVQLGAEGATIVVAGGTRALDHTYVGRLLDLADVVPVQRLLLRAVEVHSVVERVDARGLYPHAYGASIPVPGFEPWVRWSGGRRNPADPRFRVEGWIPGDSVAAPEVHLAGASQFHPERVERSSYGTWSSSREVA